MTKWLVRLQGDEHDLEALCERFDSPGWGITKENDGYYLKSSDFDSLIEADDVRSCATGLLASINGFAQIFLGQFEPVQQDGLVVLVNKDGTRQRYMAVSSEVKIRWRTSVSATSANGSPVTPQPPTEAEAWHTLVSKDRDVEDALYFFQQGTTWGSLRKVYEIIKEDFGQPSKIEKYGWASKEEIERFKESANNPQISGHDAVHARSKRTPRYSPMSLSEGRGFIHGVVRHYLQWKLNKQMDTP